MAHDQHVQNHCLSACSVKNGECWDSSFYGGKRLYRWFWRGLHQRRNSSHYMARRVQQGLVSLRQLVVEWRCLLQALL